MKIFIFIGVIIGVPVAITFAMSLLNKKTKIKYEEDNTTIYWDCEAQEFYEN